MKLGIFVILLITTTTTFAEENCGILNEQFLYNDGHSLADLEHPWVVLLISPDERNALLRTVHCQGVLISKRIVVTANHCLQTDFRDSIEVALDIGERTFLYAVERIILNPTFNYERKIGDIGLLRLNRDVDFYERLQPLCIPPPDQSIAYNDYVTTQQYVTGYEFADSTGDAKRSKSFAHILSPKFCQNIWLDELQLQTTQHICVRIYGGREYVAGAPLMAIQVEDNEPKYFYLLGIASFDKHNNTEFPLIFTRVQRYLNWIKRYLN